MTDLKETKRDAPFLHQSVAGFTGILGHTRGREAFLRGRHHKGTRCLAMGSSIIAVYPRDDWQHWPQFRRGIIFTGRAFHRGRPLQAAALREIPRLTDLDGRFAYLAWKPNHVELGTDCIGAGPVFYTVQNGCLYFGSLLGLLMELLPDSPAFSEMGLAAQLFARAQVFDESHFRGIARLSAGSRLRAEFDPASGKTKSRILPGSGVRSLLELDVPKLSPGSIRDFINEGVEREQFDSDSVLMLSGGKDSLAIALADAPVPRRAMAYGARHSADIISSRLRSEKLGMEHTAIVRRSWSFTSHAREITGLHAGCTGLQAAQQLVAFIWARDHAKRAAIGFLGDCLTGSHLGTRARPSMNHVFRMVVPDFRDPILRKAFPREMKVLFDFVRSRYADLSKEIGGHRALMILDLEWRQARWISMHFDLCDWYLPIACPLFQRRFVASCLQAEPELLLHQRAYTEALTAALAERGLPYPFPNETNLLRWVISAARRLKREPVKKNDWPAIIANSKLDIRDYMCGHDQLDEVTRRSWRERDTHEWRPFPVVCSSLPIAAAFRRASRG